MMLPFAPQALSDLRKRIPAALGRVYNSRSDDRPWEHPEHVFDLESGLRLVVAIKDLWPGPYLHVVAEVMPHTLLWSYHAFLRGDDTRLDHHLAHLRRMVPGQFKELHPTPVKFLLYSEGVPHFFGDLHEMDRTESRLLAF